MQVEFEITPRDDLDFDLAGDIPRFWFGNDPSRSRFFDAHSLLTPSGERFFIESLRAYRDEISDPQLKEDVRRFIFQEGQHSQQHAMSNRRFQTQGLDADAIEAELQETTQRRSRGLSRSFAVALTAASEHLTTVIADAVMNRPEYFRHADKRIFALYAWHCAEELEHKSVCFDVMQKVARVGYAKRTLALLAATLVFQLDFARMMSVLLRADGFSFSKRCLHYWRGLVWMYGKQGLLRHHLRHFLAYFHPRFHPTRYGHMHGYIRWLETFKRCKDPLLASAALRQAI